MKHIRAILILPFMAAIVIPGVLLLKGGSLTIGLPFVLPVKIFSVLVGLLLIGGGLFLLFNTIRLFATQGDGTLAPWDPTQKLVVTGVYCYVRNPMISGVMGSLLGEAVVFGSWRIFVWFVLFAIINMVYIPLSEEPGLLKRFGEDYRIYCQNVPRWIPRMTAWQPPASK